MTSKKQKRLAGEARAAERDAAHEAEIKARQEAARRRHQKRLKREAEQARQAQSLKTAKLIGGMRPKAVVAPPGLESVVRAAADAEAEERRRERIDNGEFDRPGWP